MTGHVYLDLGTASVAAFHHAPGTSDPAKPAVVLVAPFGWQDVASYRMRREWAARLAGAGHHVLRLDLPGAGDSAGLPGDPDRLGAWTLAVDGAAAWLRAASGALRVVAVGLGLGGVPAWLAAARDGGAVDDLVLWAVPARGRSLVRELRAFGSMAATEWRDADPPPDAVGVPEGWLEVAGYVLSEETLTALSALDLTAVALPDAARRRALLLGRDGAPADEKLRGALTAARADVTTAEGPGWGAMTTGPQDAAFPEAVAAALEQWLAAAPAEPGPGAAAPAPPVREQLALGAVRERAWTLDRPGGTLFGVLAEPAEGPRAPLGVVLLNAGAVRHTGPNRMWVEAARAWAARGVPVLRIDIEGIGDSDGDHAPYVDDAALYAPELSTQGLAVVHELVEQGVASTFVVGGLCSGAYWAFHGALAQEARVQAVLLVNLFAFFFEEELRAEADAQAARRAASGGGAGAVLRVLRGETDVARVRATAAHLARTPFEAAGRRRRRRRRAHQVEQAFDRVRDAGARIHLLLGRDEPAYARLERDGHVHRLGEWPNVRLHRLPTRDHTFRAVWQQQHVRRLLDEVVDEELSHAARQAEGAA